MIDIDKLMEICRQTDEAISEIYAPGPAVTCTRTFTILPLRYAVVTGTKGHRRHLPELAPTLRHLEQAVELSQASYAVRTLREGFLYVLEKRRLSGQHHWHRPYRIDADGMLSVIEPGFPWTPPSPSPKSLDEIRSPAWAFRLHDLDDLQQLRLFYSPDPLTLAAQQKLLQRRDIMPALNVAKYTTPFCSAPEPHILTHDQLDQVADFAALSNPVVRELLEKQLHGTPQLLSMNAAYQWLKPEQGSPNPRGVAIVVEDAIGITQELNAWRNAAVEQLKDWLESPGGFNAQGERAASYERHILVARAFLQLREEFSERKVAALVDNQTQLLRERLDHPSLPAPLNRQENVEGLIQAHAAAQRSALQARAEKGEFVRIFEERYLSRVDHSGMQTHLLWFEFKSREIQALAGIRASDHIAWLQHPKLIDALAFYDDADPGHGLCFAHQTGLCVMGMESSDAGAQLIKRWWRAERIEPGNLALRAFTYNQRSIAEVLEHTRQQLDTLPQGSDLMQQLDLSLKYIKDLAAQFSRMDAHLDIIAQHLQPHTAGALVWLGQLGRETLRAGGASGIEHTIQRRLNSYLIASLGEQAVNLRMAEYADADEQPSRGRVAAPILRRLEKAYVDNLRGAHNNTFFRTRVASGLLLLEAGILLMQGQREEKDARFWSEVSAMALTTAAAGMELLAVGTEQALANVGANSVTARGAQISLGRYRLWGAGLAAAGAVVGIGWDAHDAWKEANKAKPLRNNLLVSAYSVRVMGTVALVAGQGGIAFSQAGAYFNWLALNSSYSLQNTVYKAFAKLASRLAASRTGMLLLGRASWIGGAVFIGSTIGLVILDSNALEKWCDKCCFTLVEGGSRYLSNSEELSAFFNAIEEVL